MKITILFLLLLSNIDANPSLSYLDDSYEYNGENSTNIFGIIFNVLFWMGIIVYWIKSAKN